MTVENFVELSLPVPLVHHREFVLRVRTIRESRRSGPDPAILNSRGAVRIDRRSRLRVGDLLAAAQHEPEFVFYDRTSDRSVEIFDLHNRILVQNTRSIARNQRAREIRSLPAAIAAARVKLSVKHIAAGLRDEIGQNTTGGDFSVEIARRVGHFLDHGVVYIILNLAIDEVRIDHHPVERVGAMDGGVPVG
jgi:hypothetical protein